MSIKAWHGTLGGYNNHGCRCDDCRKANTEAQRKWRKYGTSRQEGVLDKKITEVENAPSWKEWKAGL